MKVTLTILFVLAMVVSSTQTFRHFYVRFLEPRDSLLDEFRTDTESSITAAERLNELVELYRAAQNKVDLYESDSSNPNVVQHQRRNTMPYKAVIQIEKEILNREHDQRQLTKLWFYWGCGLISLILGFITFRIVNSWLGFSAIVTGFSEMLAWTSPLFHNRILSLQFEQLLDFKLLLSILTWIILVAVWLFVEKYGYLKQRK